MNSPFRLRRAVGRPNAGKSTLLNRLVGEKIAAVSNKPQTTRFKILGIVNRPEGQIVLVDTPGVHNPGYELNRRMMSAVHDALLGVDVVCLIRDASAATGNGDRFVLDLVKHQQAFNATAEQNRKLLTIKTVPLIELYQKDRLESHRPNLCLKGASNRKT